MSSSSTNSTAHQPPSSSPQPTRSLAARIGTFLFQQLLALAVFVGFPALVTAIAPVSWVTFERHDGRVTATTRTCLLFVVPYKHQTVEPVVGLGDRLVEGTYSRERRKGRDRYTKSEDEGFLVIRGPGQTVEVSVTPHNLESVVERSETFLDDPQARELKLFVVANWKFSMIVGGLLSLLTVLYVVILAFGIALKILHLFQALMGVPPERRWLAKQLQSVKRSAATANR